MEPAPPLTGETTADVVIIGGGYTGMWTAYFLSERAPGTRIVLLEQDICGGGPSGRNGGFVHGWWEVLPYLVKRYGAECGLEAALAADEVVDGIGEWCALHGVDAWFHKAGYLEAHAFPAQASGFERTAETTMRLGAPGQLVGWDPEAVQRVCASPAFRDGLFMPSAASIQPARLARGLRRVLLERGVVIHESTRVHHMETPATTSINWAAMPGDPAVRVWTDGGSVRAHQAVLAVNAWAAGWPGHRMRLPGGGSYMVVTEPIPDRLAAWAGREASSAQRYALHDQLLPHHRTGGLRSVRASAPRVWAGGSTGRTPPTSPRRGTGGVQLRPPPSDAGRRPLRRRLGRTNRHHGPPLPEIGTRDGGRVHYAYGFSGNGAGPSRLAGRVLAALVDDRDDPLAQLAFVGRRQRILPPEPFRFIGARVIREALIRRDDALDAGQTPSFPVRMIARVPGWMGYRFEH